MRRLASVVFAAPPKRSDKSDAPPPTTGLIRKKSRVFPSLSRKHFSSTDPQCLPPLVASDLVNSSSSSSSGSTTIRTPDDDGLPRTSSRKGSWKSWLGGKNASASDHLEERRTPPWQALQDHLRSSKSGSNETDDTSLQSDDPCGGPDDALVSSYSPQLMAIARANARTVIMNNSVCAPTSPPLFQLPDAISFPRSCHSPRRLRRHETLESKLHKKSLLARLDRLSPSELSSIAPLASKQIPRDSQTHPTFPDDIFPSADLVNLRSSGLEKWVSRPCFEDRLQLWTHSDSGEITRTRIPGSHLGVAALEFSEALELLAGTLLERDDDVEADMHTSEFSLPPLTLDLDPSVTQVKELALGPLSPPSSSSQSQGPSTELPPPPHLSHASQALLDAPVRQRSESTTSGSATTNDPVPKRGVRFADDDGKDDQIPLGYVLRIRKNKEQKARFLREERERRQRRAQLSTENRRATVPQENLVPRIVVPRRPPPRPLVSLNETPKPQQPASVSHVVREEDRLRLEFEKVEMEKLRRSRDLAKKQAEERERTYAEELQATRARREASRAGRPLESVLLSSRAPDRDHSASRDSTQASLPRSSMSRKHTPELVFTPVSPHDGSPSSSLPATPGSQHSFSRPPSIYSSHTASSEDVRGRDSRFSRRMSVVSDSAKGVSLHPPYDPRTSFNPYAWTNVPPVPAIPPVLTMPIMNGSPFYGMDMPLLPPTPPFMMNQFGARPRSYMGLPGQHSPLQSSTSLPRNGSFEGAKTSSRNSSPHSSGSHQRRSSDDATGMGKGSRSSSYVDVRASKASVSMRGVPFQSNPQRSSWLPPDQNLTKRSSSLRPVYSSGAPTDMRRRTTAS